LQSLWIFQVYQTINIHLYLHLSSFAIVEEERPNLMGKVDLDSDVSEEEETQQQSEEEEDFTVGYEAKDRAQIDGWSR
jgi:hypothetical protein